jgi:hypothetical protein
MSHHGVEDSWEAMKLRACLLGGARSGLALRGVRHVLNSFLYAQVPSLRPSTLRLSRALVPPAAFRRQLLC